MQFLHIFAADYTYVVLNTVGVAWIKLGQFRVAVIVKFLVIGSCRSGNNTIVSEERVTSSVV
jgi:hypothetical protein